MTARRTAIVAGAFGAVGRALVGHLEALGGWDVVGVGRRTAAPTARVRYLQLDLTDPGACGRASRDLPAAVFVVLHVPPGVPSALAPVLQRCTGLVVAAASRR